MGAGLTVDLLYQSHCSGEGPLYFSVSQWREITINKMQKENPHSEAMPCFPTINNNN